MESFSALDAKLFNAADTGDLEGVTTALAQGGRVASRDPTGRTSLLAAAYCGHTDICVSFCRAGKIAVSCHFFSLRRAFVWPNHTK